MKSKIILVAFAAIFAVAIFALQASAFATINKVNVDGRTANQFGSGAIAVTAGENIFVEIFFTADNNVSDVRVRAELDGEGFLETKKMPIISGNSYREVFTLRLPEDIDPSEIFDLEVSIRAQGETTVTESVRLEVQRSSDKLNIFSVETPGEVKAGKFLPIDVVLANFGYEEAKNNRATARIPELGASATVFFGDLSRKDQGSKDKEDDAEERRIMLQIPSDAPAGLYTIEIEAFNSEASVKTTKRVVVVGAQADSRVVSSSAVKTFAVGEQKAYTLTLVNAGDTIRVYELEFDAPEGLIVDTEDSIVVVPAGSSKTVKLNVMSSKQGSYNFGVNVNSDGELIKRENFTAKVEGRSLNVNASVLLTVVLAIIFVVLVIVLIVLLTRKPAKKEELGESYY